MVPKLEVLNTQEYFKAQRLAVEFATLIDSAIQTGALGVVTHIELGTALMVLSLGNAWHKGHDALETISWIAEYWRDRDRQQNDAKLIRDQFKALLDYFDEGRTPVV